MRVLTIVAIAAVCVFAPLSRASDPVTFRSLDGGGNNVLHPDWGQSGHQYLRVAAPNYANGIGSMMGGPNPRRVSNRTFNDTSQNIFSERNVSQWSWLWGQFLDHTFGLRDETPGASSPIAFDASDPLEDFTNSFGAIDFARTPAAPGTGSTTPRQQINTLPSYIDAFAIYGGTQGRLDWLLRDSSALFRLPGNYLPLTGERGNVDAAPPMDLMGPLTGRPENAIVSGDVRANENIALTGVHTLFEREHDRIVSALPDTLSAADKFDIARRVVGAEQQYITYSAFLPAMGLQLAPYHGYDPTVNATLSNEFATVGYRAHSQIHGEMEAQAPAGRYTQAEIDAFEAQGMEVLHENGLDVVVVPLNLAFGNPSLLPRIGIGPLLKGLAAEHQYKNDEMIDNQLRSVLFQVPVSANPTCLDGPDLPSCFDGVVDLGAIDIKRGRDHGMPTYNQMRIAYGLPAKGSFAAVTGESTESLPSGLTINDPHILDFTSLRDANGQEVDRNDADAMENDVITAVKRSALAARLKALYGTVASLDAFTGMVAEPHVAGTEFGELQLAMWKKQFEALRDGDRLFYASDPYLGTIKTQYGIDYRVTLKQVIEANTDAHVQDNVFIAGSAPEPVGKLVAAYSFDAGAGPVLADVSGNGNNGAIANATWSPAGHSGSALSFNGTNAMVTVPDSASLDLRNALTLEAWVKPTAVGSWETALLKEQPGELVYGLYASTDTGRASGHLFVNGMNDEFWKRGTSTVPVNAWTHLATTYNGATLRVYVNGVLQSSIPASGPVQQSGGALRIGGNAIWGEWFSGLMDDVRVYSRPLNDAEIQADMATPVAVPPTPTGLVAAYAFDAGSGTQAVDSSGRGNTGALANATWSPSGHSGSALSFNGTNAWVTVPDSSSLDLTTAMTLEAWVKPSQESSWATTLLKETSGELVYGLYATTDTGQPSAHVLPAGTATDLLVRGAPDTPVGTWTHLAATYDGTTLRVYVNGAQQGSRAVSGPIQTSSGPLRIGGNSVWGEWFAGLIDDVRVYNRALGTAEIQADMGTAVH